MRGLAGCINVLILGALCAAGCSHPYRYDLHSTAFYTPSFHHNADANTFFQKVRFSTLYEKSVSEVDDRVFTYLKEHPETPHEVAKAMLRYEIVRGMSPEEVIVVAGESPRVQVDEETGDEFWTYGYLLSDQRKVTVHFSDSRVVNIHDYGIPPLFN